MLKIKKNILKLQFNKIDKMKNELYKSKLLKMCIKSNKK